MQYHVTVTGGVDYGSFQSFQSPTSNIVWMISTSYLFPIRKSTIDNYAGFVKLAVF